MTLVHDDTPATHPYSALRNLVPGRYDDDGARWITADGSERSYWSTDNLLDPSWQGLRPSVVIDQLAVEGLEFDIETGTGVVLHMLSCLAIDGRLGLTAIGRTPEHAAERETRQLVNIAIAAGETASLEHLVLHTLPAGEKLAGKGNLVPHMDVS